MAHRPTHHAGCRAQRRPETEDERGVAAMFVILLVMAMLAVAGLVIDGGYSIAANRKAMNQAEQAARVGADSLDQGGLRDGQTVVNPDQAVAAAQAYLSSVGASGTVLIEGGEVTVRVSGQRETTVLSAVGITSLPVSGEATATSIDEGTTP